MQGRSSPSAVDLLRLYPGPGGPVALNGLYLNGLLEPRDFAEPLFVYSAFVVSLDGRIAAAPAGESLQRVPTATANPRDWRLYQELAGHADVLITSGRYLRDLDAGRAQDILPVGSDEIFADIRQWRHESGLPPQPDVAVVSGSLDFRIPQALIRQGRRVIAFTTESASAERVEAREHEGARVIRVGKEKVDGGQLCDRLAEAGYRRAYNVTGAHVLHTLLWAARLNTLFLTTVHRLVAGEPFTSLLHGTALPSPADFALSSLYYDTDANDGGGQTFARYDRIASACDALKRRAAETSARNYGRKVIEERDSMTRGG